MTVKKKDTFDSLSNAQQKTLTNLNIGNSKSKRDKSARVERFCQEYACHGNATRAGIDAGYSAKTARQYVVELLKRADVQARISELRKEREERLSITADKIREEFAKIAFFNFKDVVRLANGKLVPGMVIKNLDELTSDQTSVIKKISEERTLFGVYYRVEFYPKDEALDRLARIEGLYDSKASDIGTEEMRKYFQLIQQEVSNRDYQNRMQMEGVTSKQ